MMETHEREDVDANDKAILPDDIDGDEQWVECDYCNAEIALSADELAQGWYVCPECEQLSHLAEPGGDISDAEQAPARLKENDSDWVQLETVSGAEEASLLVGYLRANGVEALAWQEGAGRAYGLSVGSLGVSHIMVREDQKQLAQSLLEAEVEDYSEDDQSAEDALSDSSKAAMGLIAAVFNPVGTALALGLSQLAGRHDEDDQPQLVECAECGAELELSTQEIAQGHYICPECQELIRLDDYVVCPACQTQLALDKVERRQGWYRCPECEQVSQL